MAPPSTFRPPARLVMSAMLINDGESSIIHYTVYDLWQILNNFTYLFILFYFTLFFACNILYFVVFTLVHISLCNLKWGCYAKIKVALIIMWHAVIL